MLQNILIKRILTIIKEIQWLFQKGDKQEPEEIKEELIIKQRCLIGEPVLNAVKQNCLIIYVKTVGTIKVRKFLMLKLKIV